MEKDRKTHIATICRLEKVMAPSEEELTVLIPIEIAEGTIDRCKNFVDSTGERFLFADDALRKEEKFCYILDVSFDEMLGRGFEVLTKYMAYDPEREENKGIEAIIKKFKDQYELELQGGVWYYDLTELVPVLSYDCNSLFYERYNISIDRKLGALSFDEPEDVPEDEEDDEEFFDHIKDSIDSSESTPANEKVDKKVAEEKKISFANLKLKTTRKQLIADTKLRVISQDKAVERVCSAVYDPICLGINALKRNILLYGPSGSGKTYLVSTIAKLLGLPYAYQNVSKLSVSGYVGDSVNDIYTNLYLSAGGDMKKLERGAIVILDEIDKLKGTGDIKEGAYHELLDLLDDGGTVSFQLDKHSGTIQYHKENLQVFSAGTFARMLKLQDRTVGFEAKNSKIDIVTSTYNFTPDDFIEHGYPAEIMNRHKLCVPMNGLTEEDYYKILTQSIESTYVQTKNSLLEHRKINLIILEEALRYIAKTAFDLKKGARGLSGVFDDAIQQEIDAITDGIDEGRDIAGDYEIKKEEIVKRLGSLYPSKK